jgi:hypothetical protein
MFMIMLVFSEKNVCKIMDYQYYCPFVIPVDRETWEDSEVDGKTSFISSEHWKGHVAPNH